MHINQLEPRTMFSIECVIGLTPAGNFKIVLAAQMDDTPMYKIQNPQARSTLITNNG